MHGRRLTRVISNSFPCATRALNGKAAILRNFNRMSVLLENLDGELLVDGAIFSEEYVERRIIRD